MPRLTTPHGEAIVDLKSGDEAPIDDELKAFVIALDAHTGEGSEI